MQTLGFLTPPHHHERQAASGGFTLVELLVCLGVVAAVSAFALPSWQRLQERNRIEAARSQLMSDLQTARVRALQRGETLQLARLRDCTWSTSAGGDWSCGWQLVRKTDQSLLSASQIPTPLQVTFAKTDPLNISPRGDLGTVGDRWVIQSRQSSHQLANVVCLSSAGRVRWQSSDTCNN
jgi:type IV fimbrial biogenesis protein FimT